MANEQRLIDADDCGRYIACKILFRPTTAEEVIGLMADFTEQNAVDAVPVVRCKDCKYLNRKTSVGGFCKCGEVNGGRPFGRVNDDFCSYGERINNGIFKED